MRPLITALRTLTRLAIPGADAVDPSTALPYFPVVGLLIGLIVTGALYLLTLSGWAQGAGLVAMATSVWITRGLHVDGIADVADALGASRTRERRLEIMKDPHTGAFGVMAIVCNLVLKAGALTQLAMLHQWTFVLLPFVVSRTNQVMLATTLPYARPNGGKAGEFVKNARGLHLVLAICTALAICMAVGQAAGLILLLQGLLISLVLRVWMKRQFEGVTGDLLGLSNEIVETGLLMLLAFICSTAT